MFITLIYMHLVRNNRPRNYGKFNSYIEVQGQTTSVLAGAFAALLLTGTQNNSLEIAGLNFVLPSI